MRAAKVSWALALVLWASAAAGQGVTAALTGSLTDPDGLPVAAAEVVAVDERTKARRTTTSSEAGLFAFPALPLGTYRLHVTRTGFKALSTPPLALTLGQAVHAPLTLEVGRLEERVVVEQGLPALQTESAVVGEVVTGHTALLLPLKGRNVAQLALLLPGTVTPAPASVAQPKITYQGRPYVNGHREQGNLFVLDGIDVTEPLDNLPPYQPSPEALEEVRIETNNYSAEHGNLAGALIHAVVKSGTSRLQGSVFERARDDRLDANRWESNRAGARKDRLRQHVFGATLGGPLVRDRLFFFADYEGGRWDESARRAARVAPAEWREGDLSSLLGLVSLVDPRTGEPFPGNVIPRERIHPLAARLLDPALYPLPPAADGGFAYETVRRRRNHQGDLKLTTHPTPRDSGFLRLSFQDYEESWERQGWPSGLAETTEGPYAGGALGWSRSFGAGGLIEARLGYSRLAYRWGHEDVSGLGDAHVALGLEDSQTAPGLGAFYLGGLTALGSPRIETRNTEQIYSAGAKVSGLRGRHALKAGGEWLHTRVANAYSGNSGLLGYHDFTGAFSGFAFSDFLLGLPSSKGRGNSSRPWRQLQHRAALFVEDAYKARPDLTLIAGLRWAFFSPLVEAHDRQVNFDLATGRPLYAGRDGNSRALYDAYYGGFEPRLGFVYAPGARFVIRGAYGLVQSEEGRGSNLRLTQNPPFFSESSARYDASTGPGSFGFSDLAPAAGFVGQLRVSAPDFKPQVTQQWNLFVERALGRALTASVGYVGHKASRLAIPKDYNQPLPGEGPPETWLPAQERRPLVTVLPEATAVVGSASEGRSEYHGLQVVLRRRPSRGLQFLASYTLSRARSDNIGYYGADWNDVATPGFYQQNAYDREADYGPAFFDATHNLVVSGAYEMPSWLLPGVTLSSILTARTGFPITVIDSRGRSAQGSLGFERPDRVTSGRVPDPGPERWIDIDAFRPAAPGTFGNSGVGILRAPGYFMWDLGLSRSLDLGGRGRLVLEARAFNVLNHPNLGAPGRDLADPGGFGRIVSTVDAPRQVELAMKLEF